jgi:hypothetical protein
MQYVTLDTSSTRLLVPPDLRTIAVAQDQESRQIFFKLPTQITPNLSLADYPHVCIEYTVPDDEAIGKDLLQFVSLDSQYGVYVWQPDIPTLARETTIYAHLCVTLTENLEVIQEMRTADTIFKVIAAKGVENVSKYYVGKDDFLTEDEAREIVKEVYERKVSADEESS